MFVHKHTVKVSQKQHPFISNQLKESQNVVLCECYLQCSGPVSWSWEWAPVTPAKII